MFQNGQRVCFKNGGDPARIQKVQIAYGKDRSRAPQVIPTTDTNATQVQVVTGEDAARYPFIDPIGLIGAPAAWYRADTGVTVTGLGASTWADQSGNGRDLLQTTDASRPPYLSYSGTKYLYLPGVASNNATSPDSAQASVTGDIDIRLRLSAADFTPSVSVIPLSKMNAAGSYCYQVTIMTDGAIRLLISTDGTATVPNLSSASISATNGDTIWIRATRNSTTGKANFYTSTDSTNDPTAVSWTLLGVEQSGSAGAIFDGNSQLCIGSQANGTSNPFSGRIYRASIYSTIGGTTPVVDFNPDLDGSDQAATITSSATGEVWTINSSGGLPAQIVGRPSLLFDGTADFMATAAFTAATAWSVYWIIRPVSFTTTDCLFATSSGGSTGVYQNGSTPTIRVFSGSAGTDHSGPAIGAYGVISVTRSGNSFSLQTNLGAPTVDTLTGVNMALLTLGAVPGGAAQWSNQQVVEGLAFSTAHDATQRARIISYLAGRYGIAL